MATPVHHQQQQEQTLPQDDSSHGPKLNFDKIKTYLVVILIVSCILCVVFSFFVVLSSLGYRLYPPMFAVDSLTVHPFSISSAHLTANWNITFCVTPWNSDSYTFNLQDINASVLYKEEPLSSTMMVPFNANLDHEVQASMGVSSAYIDSSVREAMVGDWSLGSVLFNIEVNAAVRIMDNEHHTKRKLMSVLCEDVTVGFSSDMKTGGSMMSGKKECYSKFVSKF